MNVRLIDETAFSFLGPNRATGALPYEELKQTRG